MKKGLILFALLLCMVWLVLPVPADAALDSACLESCDNFFDGFRQGALMMMDVLLDCHG